jgi:hypothetical protein
LQLLAQDSQLRQRVITAGSATAITYDVGHMADAYERALLAAVGSSSEPSGPARDSPVGPC